MGAVVTDYMPFGNPETGIPYNYPLYAGLLYIIAVLFVLRTFHDIFDSTELELLTILDRTTADNVLFERDSDLTPEGIHSEVTDVMDRAFSPVVILASGAIGGIFSLVDMWAIDTKLPHRR